MANVSWVRQNKNQGKGNWSNTKDWSTGALPAIADTALISVGGFNGPYTITEDTTATIAALTVSDTNATLAFTTPSTTLTVNGPTILTLGTISIASATGTLSTGTFTQTGGTFLETAGALNVTGLASLTGSITDKISGGVFNAGTLTLGDGKAAETLTLAGGALSVSGATTINNLGTLKGSGTVTGGAISGAGTINASGGTLDIANTIISGLTFTIGSGSTSDLKLDGIVTSAAPITINAAVQTLEIGATGTLTIGAAETVTGGKILLDGGTLIDASGIAFGNTSGQNGFLSGFGIVEANLTRLGSAPSTITASGGTLDLTGTFDSGFNFVIGTAPNSDLKFENTGTLSAPITINNSNQTLEIGSAGNITITGPQAINDKQIVGGGGTIKLDGGTLAVSNGTTGLTIGSGGTLTGFGTGPNNITLAGGTVSQSGGVLNALFITGNGTVNGVTGTAPSGANQIVASGGTLDLIGTVSGAQLVVDPNKAGSVLKVDGNVTAGGNDWIDLHSANQTVEIGAAGNLTLSFLETVSDGTIKLDGGTLNATAGLDGSLTKVSGLGGIGVTLIGKGVVNGAISGSGVVEGQGGVLTVSNNVTSSTILLEADSAPSSVLALDGTVASGISFDYLNSGGVFSGGLLLGNTNARTSFETGGTIVGMHVGSSATATTDFIDIAGVVPGSFTSGVIVGSTIELFNGANEVDHFNLASAPGANAFVDWQTDGSGGTDVFLSAVTCFVTGTRVLTVTGERTVESLMQGDIVLTLADGELVAQPVRWVGQRRIDLTVHPRPATVAPVRIRRGAFGDNMPHADLLVSPDHAVFVEGKLISARQLINGTTIRAEKGWTAVEYFHVELDSHAILLAEGLPAESYLDTGNRGFFANGGEPLVLHPDLTDETDYPARAAGSCAPFVSDEASVRPVWQRLAERAAALGQPAPRLATTDDPELRIVAKGRTVRPLYGENGLYIFALPKGVTEVRVVSRAGSPTDARPWLDDRRCLGVNVERIVLRGANELREVPVDHPGLSRGWHVVERDEVVLRRWTNGDAVLPLPVLSGPTMLEIRAGGGGMAYVTDTGEKEQRAA